MGRLFIGTITEWVRNMLTINCIGKAVCTSELNDRRLLIFMEKDMIISKKIQQA